MHVQSKRNNVSILFLDSVNPKIDKYLRDIYHDIYQERDFIKENSHIFDSIAFGLSHHSFGIQLADYCVGILNGCLKKMEVAIELFNDLIWPKIRKSSKENGKEKKVWGYGILEVPTNNDNRKWL